MSKGIQFSLEGFTKNADGSFSKKKTSLQPRDIEIKTKQFEYKDNSGKVIFKATEYLPFEGFDANKFTDKCEPLKSSCNISGTLKLRKLTLTLFGEPMPKQSVRSYCTKKVDKASGRHILAHFQPKEMEERTADYIRQIKEQLPEGFIRFEERVHITKMHFIFQPLKAFHKIKGRMDAIRNGEIFYKNTKPDLPDNLKKLANDSMSALVYKDDSIIVSEDNVKKYYGVGGCIIIEMEGY